MIPARSFDCFGAFAAEVDVVYRALRRFGVGAGEAEDLAQEVFVVMCRRWTDYDPTRPLRPWLIGIAFRVARDHRKRRPRELSGGIVDRLDESTDPERRMAAGRARALVREALAALSEKHRAVIILHDLDGASMQEIAGALSAPLTTLYSRLATARRSFARAVRRLERQYALLPLGLPALLQAERAEDSMAAVARGRLLRRTEALSQASGSSPGPRFGWRETGGGSGQTMPARLPAASGRAVGRALPRGLSIALGVVAVTLAIRVLWAPAAADARVAHRPEPMGGPVSRAALARHLRVPAVRAVSLVAPAAASLAQGLVGYWRFDEGPASGAARDLSGQGTDCWARGAGVEWTPGRFGAAVSLGGLGWLECPQPRFGRSADLTVAAWIRRPRAQKGMRVIATRQLGGGARDHFFFGLVGDELSVTSHVWGGPLHHLLPPAGDRWVHVAAVHRDGEVHLYMDGLEVASRRSYRGRHVDTDTPLLIGAGINGPDPAVTTQRFAGAIDELAVYDRPLAPEEIAALAAGQQPPLSR